MRQRPLKSALRGALLVLLVAAPLAAAPAPAADFTGLYETNWGRLRLTQDEAGNVTGRYAGGGTLEGDVAGNRLEYQYAQEGSVGSGWFELSADGRALSGVWSLASGWGGGEWSGERVQPEPDVVWLIVLEAHWETSLAETEYSFGEMLRTYFERYPHVRVRHRRLTDRGDFTRAAEDLALLAEPVALWLSGHGTAGQLQLEDGGLGAHVIADAVRHADNVFLLHFSSCEMMVPGVTETIRAALPAGRDLAMSGYAVPVDWGASAVLEMLYLDLVVGRRFAPREAATVVRTELHFAGAAATPGSPLGALEFRIE